MISSVIKPLEFKPYQHQCYLGVVSVLTIVNKLEVVILNMNISPHYVNSNKAF